MGWSPGAMDRGMQKRLWRLYQFAFLRGRTPHRNRADGQPGGTQLQLQRDRLERKQEIPRQEEIVMGWREYEDHEFRACQSVCEERLPEGLEPGSIVTNFFTIIVAKTFYSYIANEHLRLATEFFNPKYCAYETGPWRGSV